MASPAYRPPGTVNPKPAKNAPIRGSDNLPANNPAARKALEQKIVLDAIAAAGKLDPSDQQSLTRILTAVQAAGKSYGLASTPTLARSLVDQVMRDRGVQGYTQQLMQAQVNANPQTPYIQARINQNAAKVAGNSQPFEAFYSPSTSGGSTSSRAQGSGGSSSGSYDIADIIKKLEKEQKAANKSNEDRYAEMLANNAGVKGELMGMLDSARQQQLGTLDSQYQQMLGLAGTGEKTQMDREALLRQNELGGMAQSAVDRGLANTTIQDTMRRGVIDASALRQREISDSANQQRLGLQQNYANQLLSLQNQFGQQGINLTQGLYQDRNQIIGSRTDAGPDFGQWANLLSQQRYGAGGTPAYQPAQARTGGTANWTPQVASSSPAPSAVPTASTAPGMLATPEKNGQVQLKAAGQPPAAKSVQKMPAYTPPSVQQTGYQPLSIGLTPQQLGYGKRVGGEILSPFGSGKPPAGGVNRLGVSGMDAFAGKSMDQINAMVAPYGGAAMYGAFGGHRSTNAQQQNQAFNSFLGIPGYSTGQSSGMANMLGYQGTSPAYRPAAVRQPQLVPVNVNGQVQWIEV